MTAATEIGRLDALVLNAAITRDRALVRMSVQDWDDVVRVNLRGPFLATEHALRFTMRQKCGLNGTVVHGHGGIAY